MANEITLSVRITVVKSSAGINDDNAIGSLSVTMTGNERLDNIQSIGTSEEAIAGLADIATPGWCLIENLDATNYVNFRPATGAANGIEIKATEFALFRIPRAATAPYMIANTAACRCRIRIWED